MRLTQIRLAGFKSFVDPTTVNVPGQLVGVVGPNGCGKSNIIDAVRWVLGESRAAALRGDSMQDVIFNGSSLRKPVARASVELSFDNSLGRAAGQCLPLQYRSPLSLKLLALDPHTGVCWCSQRVKISSSLLAERRQTCSQCVPSWF